MNNEVIVNVEPGEPVQLQFGPKNARHIVATVFAVGMLRYFEGESVAQEHKDEHPRYDRTYRLVDADWITHPEEAAVDFELRDGDKVIERHTFKALEDCVMDEPEQDIAWNRVHAFAGKNGIGLHLEEAFCANVLERELDRQYQSKAALRLATPAPALQAVGMGWR